MFNRKALTALVLGTGVALVACSGGKGTTIDAGAPVPAPAEVRVPAVALATPVAAVPDQTASGNIVQVAQSAGQFNTLLAAVEAAGLTSTLEGPGPLHGLRADRRRVRQDPEVDARFSPRRQGDAHQDPHLPRAAGQGDVGPDHQRPDGTDGRRPVGDVHRRRNLGEGEQRQRGAGRCGRLERRDPCRRHRPHTPGGDDPRDTLIRRTSDGATAPRCAPSDVHAGRRA